MPRFSSIALAFEENVIYLAMFKFWENAHYQYKNYFKTKSSYPNLTIMPPITGGNLKFALTGGCTP